MSKSRIVKNPNKLPSTPRGSTSRPPGAAPIATSNDPDKLIDAMLYGNRETKRLAKQKWKSSKYEKFIKRNGV